MASRYAASFDCLCTICTNTFLPAANAIMTYAHDLYLRMSGTTTVINEVCFSDA